MKRSTCCKSRLPTNFKVGAFRLRRITRRCCARWRADIEAIRYDCDGAKIELPVKLKVHNSIFVPLAKWAMLLTGNYRCVQKDGARSIRDAVHARHRRIARGIQLGVRALQSSSAPIAQRSRAVREICERGAGAGRVPHRPRARCSPALPTSSGSTGSCRASRRRRACAIRWLTRRLRWSTPGSQSIEKPLPDLIGSRAGEGLFAFSTCPGSLTHEEADLGDHGAVPRTA